MRDDGPIRGLRAVLGIGACAVAGMAAGCAGEDEAARFAEDAAPFDAGRSATDVHTFMDGDDAPCSNVCSDDLHTVLDCKGGLVETCPPNDGCRDGACRTACEAASARMSSVGCDFFAYYSDSYVTEKGDCFAAFLANTWNAPLTIEVDRDGQSFDATAFAYVPSGNGQAITYAPLADGKLEPGQVAILFLAGTPNAHVKCPAGITPAVTTDPAVHGTGIGSAFHIRTSAPVALYDIVPYGGGGYSESGSASLVLPTHVWGTNYIGVDPYEGSNDPDWPWLAIVSMEDDTTVTLNPKATLPAGGPITEHPKGTAKSYTLGRGQVLQFELPIDTQLVGTPIDSSKPVAVWGGSTCIDVPIGWGLCDSAHQQIPPVNALGWEYAAVRPRDRYDGVTESPPWRIVGAVDGTRLSYAPAKPDGAPDSIDSGEMAEFATSEPVVVHSQGQTHPFYMAGYMTGCQVYGGPDWYRDCRGDPEFVNVVPTQQYMSSYTFFTDPTYPETHLVVVRGQTKGAFADVSLDCVGNLTDWHPLAGSFEWTRVDLVRHNFAPQGDCNNGRHAIESAGPFTITVWGWGSGETGGDHYAPATATAFYTQGVSYAYPGGTGVKSVTDAVVQVPK